MAVLRPHRTIPACRRHLRCFYQYSKYIMQVPDSEAAKVRTIAFAGRSSDLLPSGRLPVVYATTVAGVLSGLWDEAHSSGPVRDFHPIPFCFPCRMATGKPAVTKIKIISEMTKIWRRLCYSAATILSPLISFTRSSSSCDAPIRKWQGLSHSSPNTWLTMVR